MARSSSRLLAAIVGALFLPAVATSTSNADRPASSTTTVPRGPAELRCAMLASHNAARAAVGVPPIAWSNTLAADALAHARALATSGRFEHASPAPSARLQGENLWLGSRGTYAYETMVGQWTAEAHGFINLPQPFFSHSGHWQDVAHYSQIIWRGTTEVGCALMSDAAMDYLVCRYAPSGNLRGERAF